MSDISPAVYFTKDIIRLFDCGANEVPRLIDEGTIPRPLPGKPRGRRRWSRAAVDRKLGISTEALSKESVVRIVSEELDRIFRERD